MTLEEFGKALDRHRRAVAEAGKPFDLVEAEVELLGLSHVEGVAAYKLKIHHGCEVEYRWLDMRSFGELKRAGSEATTARLEEK